MYGPGMPKFWLQNVAPPAKFAKPPSQEELRRQLHAELDPLLLPIWLDPGAGSGSGSGCGDGTALPSSHCECHWFTKSQCRPSWQHVGPAQPSPPQRCHASAHAPAGECNAELGAPGAKRGTDAVGVAGAAGGDAT
mmetsp:Transcript_55549/g.157596  ORF Transcript_55549/g.157596 Transcript_55549/m.157596 type:complete len:136 (+) Transcript_55549:879-1286(+)